MTTASRCQQGSPFVISKAECDSPSSIPAAMAWSIWPCLALPVSATTMFLPRVPDRSAALISLMAVRPSITIVESVVGAGAEER